MMDSQSQVSQGGENISQADVENNASADMPWYSSLPEVYQMNPNINKYATLDEMVKGHDSLVKMVGRDKIAIPKTDEEWKEVYGKLGRPEKPEDYKFDDLEVNLDPNMYPLANQEEDLKWYSQLAHEVGLSNAQANKLYKEYISRQGGLHNIANTTIENEMYNAKTTLQSKWGKDYDGNVNLASRTMTKLFGDSVAKTIMASGLGRNVAFIEKMYDLGLKTHEELGIDKTGHSVKTAADHRQELAEIQRHPAYFDKRHPDHQTYVDRAIAINTMLSS